MSEVEQNKELIRRYTEAIWSGQAAEGEFYAPDAVQHVLQSPSGVPSLAQTAGYFRAALPDVRLGGNMVFGQDDRVMQYFDVTGTRDHLLDEQ